MKTKIVDKLSTSVLMSLALILFGATIIKAAPGDLDPTFGSGGIVITGGNLDIARAMAIQSDGKIVVVGSDSANISGNVGRFAVVRYNTDGSLDSSFGGTGIVISQLGHAYSVAIQADGKIVVAGAAAGNYFTVLRFNPNGTQDPSFNGGDIFVGNCRDHAYSVAIQADGKIVAAGFSEDNSCSTIHDYDFALVRYNTNGTLDTSFNGTGKVITSFGSTLDVASSVAIQSDGKIVAAGSSGINGGYYGHTFTLARYNADGTLDTSFNGTGKLMTPVGGGFGTGAEELALQTDGKIVVAGIANANFAFVRYNPNGSLDTSFGGTGKIIIQVGYGGYADLAYSVTIQSDGKIVAAGQGGSGDEGGHVFAVVRLNPNGTLDTTFNGTGKVLTPITGSFDYAAAVAIQSDGKIVAAGVGGDSNVYDFAVVRYQGGSNSNIRTRFDFDGDGRADISVFRPSDGVWYLNQSANEFSSTQFGLPTDKITPADYDGDGKTDIAVFRDGTWYLLRSTAGLTAVQFGLVNDIPQPADFDGDGRAELAVYRGGIWYTLNLTNSQVNTVQFGNSNDKPVVGDYDGDGRSDYAVYRDGTWYLNRSTQGLATIQFGLSTDKLVPADYDGDGKTDLAVYRDGTWFLLCSQTGLTTFQFGLASDVPTPADYDGDGRTDAAVYRDGVWYLRQSTGGISIQQFGLTNDKPIPAAYLP